MSKTIKFNLICDDNPIRTIEDLQENFSVEDVLKYYHNGLLLRWLTVRGYTEEQKEVSAIKDTEPLAIIKKLIKIFDIAVDEKNIEENIYIIKYRDEENVLNQIYKENGFKRNQIIEDYQSGYLQIIDDIYNNPHNITKIKAAIAELAKNYQWLIEMDNRRLFWTLYEHSPLAILCMLMNDVFRAYYLHPQTNTSYSKEQSDKQEIYQTLCNFIHSSNFKNNMKDHIQIFTGATDEYWKDLEPKGKKFMIISMEQGNYVRAAGLSGGDMTCNDIKDKFVIIDGIDYKSNHNSDALCYMEV